MCWTLTIHTQTHARHAYSTVNELSKGFHAILHIIKFNTDDVHRMMILKKQQEEEEL